MISAVAVVPGTPLLLPENVGRVDPVPELRVAARSAVASVAAQADRVVVVTASDVDPRHTHEPLGVRVARTLLTRDPDDLVVVGWDAPTDVCRGLGSGLAGAAASGPGRTALVVVADGCATRTEKAPGHLDARSFDVDTAWLKALGGDEFRCPSPAPMHSWSPADLSTARAVDARGLLALDAGLAAELHFQGRAPLQVLAGVLAERARGVALTAYALMVGDPFGVRYVVLAAR